MSRASSRPVSICAICEQEYGGCGNNVHRFRGRCCDDCNDDWVTPVRMALCHAKWWQYFAARMDHILFAAPKIKFIDVDGQPGKSPAQGTCLMALGHQGCTALYRAAGRGLGLITIPDTGKAA